MASSDHMLQGRRLTVGLALELSVNKKASLSLSTTSLTSDQSKWQENQPLARDISAEQWGKSLVILTATEGNTTETCRAARGSSAGAKLLFTCSRGIKSAEIRPRISTDCKGEKRKHLQELFCESEPLGGKQPALPLLSPPATPRHCPMFRSAPWAPHN